MSSTATAVAGSTAAGAAPGAARPGRWQFWGRLMVVP